MLSLRREEEARVGSLEQTKTDPKCVAFDENGPEEIEKEEK